MSDPLPEAVPPQTARPPVDPRARRARTNMLWGWALAGLFVVLFGGTVLVALVYLAVD